MLQSRQGLCRSSQFFSHICSGASLLAGVVMLATAAHAQDDRLEETTLPQTGLVHNVKQDNLETVLRIDPDLADIPSALREISDHSKQALRRFASQARADYAQMCPDTPTNGQSMDREWCAHLTFVFERNVTLSLMTPDAGSIFVSDYIYGGGAHGNLDFASVLIDRQRNEAIFAEQMFEGLDSDAKRFDQFRRVVWSKLSVEKARRYGEDYHMRYEEQDWPLPTSLAGYQVFTLVPSDTPGKAAGVNFHFAPYIVGSFAEGPYEVSLDFDDLKPFIAPDYQDWFGGEPLVVKPLHIVAGTEDEAVEATQGPFFVIGSNHKLSQQGTLTLEGAAPPIWFFEGDFPVSIVVNGTTVGQAIARAVEGRASPNGSSQLRAFEVAIDAGDVAQDDYVTLRFHLDNPSDNEGPAPHYAELELTR